ncbi:MAG: PKD domain-containing protein, partial [Flammeovirgaceae bacterium]
TGTIASYEWDFDFTGIFNTDATGITPNTTYMAAGTYTVALRVTTDNGCIDTVQQVIEIFPNPVVDFSANNTDLCEGESVDIRVALTVGAHPFTFTLDSAGTPLSYTVTNSADTTLTFTPQVASSTAITNITFSLREVQDANGCSGALPAAIVVAVNPKPLANLTGDATICDGDSTELNISITDIAGGLYTINYHELDEAKTTVLKDSTLTGITNPVDFFVTPSLSNISTPTSSFYVIDSITNTVTGCVNTDFADTVQVTVNPLPKGTMTLDQQLICDNNSVKVTFDISQGQPSFDVFYQVNGDPDTLSSSSTSFDRDYVLGVNTTFQLDSIVDGNGCVFDTSQIIDVQVIEDVALAPAFGACEEDTIDITITTNNVYDALTYDWRVDGGNTASTDSIFKFAATVGTYLVSVDITATVTVGGETTTCNFAHNTTVTFGNEPEALDDIIQIVCFEVNPEDTLSITIDPNYSVSWLNPEDDTDVLSDTTTLAVTEDMYEDADTVTYPVIITDNATGCFIIDSVTSAEVCPSAVVAPNAFIPGLKEMDPLSTTSNERFRPKAKNIGEYDLRIYDRWGKLIYREVGFGESELEQNGWNGGFKGVFNDKMPAGVYPWVFVYVDLLTGESREMQGSTALIR